VGSRCIKHQKDIKDRTDNFAGAPPFVGHEERTPFDESGNATATIIRVNADGRKERVVRRIKREVIRKRIIPAVEERR
jgi:hypothetical protein